MTSIELHIYGPAFGLPSIDASCAAAVAHLAQSLPPDQWSLVASNGIGLDAPELPALRLKDGKVISGLDNILHHIDQPLETTGRSKADCTAFTSYIYLHLLPLLSLSLYLTSQNYNEVTTSAWNKILPSPSQYYVPPNQRKKAERQTQHLGLSSLDLDIGADTDEVEKRRQSILPAPLKGLSIGGQTVTSVLKQERAKERFKLDALIENALEPLSQLLGDRRWFLDEEQPSSLDALALGCLSIAYRPILPVPWLKDGFKRYPNLVTFVERGIENVYGGNTDVSDALQVQENSTTSGKLPWRAAPSVTLSNRATGLLEEVAQSTPLSWTDDRIIAQPQGPKAPTEPWNPVYLGLAATAAIAAAAGTFAFTSLAQPFQGRSEPRKLSELGEAGAMLNMFDFGPPPNSSDLAPREGRIEITGVGLEKDDV